MKWNMRAKLCDLEGDLAAFLGHRIDECYVLEASAYFVLREIEKDRRNDS